MDRYAPPPLGSNCESHTFTGMYCACIDIPIHELTHVGTLQKYTYMLIHISVCELNNLAVSP